MSCFSRSYNPFDGPNENPEAELPLTAGRYLYVHGDMDEDGFYEGLLNVAVGGCAWRVPYPADRRAGPPDVHARQPRLWARSPPRMAVTVDGHQEIHLGGWQKRLHSHKLTFPSRFCSPVYECVPKRRAGLFV